MDLRRVFLSLESRSPAFGRMVRSARRRLMSPPASVVDEAYESRVASELERFKDDVDVHALPEIFHYWSNRYLLPMFEEFGIKGIDDFYIRYLFEAAERSHKPPRFISIGSGNGDLEVRVADGLRKRGLTEFTLECLELNPHMIARGQSDAAAAGLSQQVKFVAGDFNRWQPKERYAAVMANHSLHHVVNLEGLFDAIAASLEPEGVFVTSDMIGRNGHQRWPEALAEVQRFWAELPAGHRYNRLLSRDEPSYINHDCSDAGFEGIRAQDILPLLVERFSFELFIGFANVIAPFVDRCFGHNFDAASERDRDLIDRIHRLDEEGFQSGRLKPTQMIAVMRRSPVANPRYSRGLSPAASIRRPG